jgi:hypothetical protein
MTTASDLGERLKLRRAGRGFTGACPSCGYPSGFSAHEHEGRTLVHCAVGCEQVEVITALMRQGLWGGAGVSMPAAAAGALPERVRRGRGTDTLSLVRRIMGRSAGAEGTVVATYLRARGIRHLLPRAIRFAPLLRHAPTGTTWPAMVAAVEDQAGHVVGLHRTWLREDGSGKAPVEPAKMTLGVVKGGAVRLADAGPHLIVGEGIESTLSAMEPTGLPGWAALSTGGLRALVLPPSPAAGVVTIAADNDGPGLEAAHAAADRWAREGRTVRVAVPPAPFTDWNDALRAEVAHAA